ncbi:MAG: FAD-dependent oxidoreductase [Victivallaceae bacterium]|nr:FAD-dependent oxidoreductase [Victivallaceae bacterium]
MKVRVPVIFGVDLLLVGGTCENIVLALEAARAGKRTFILTPYTFFGEEWTATLDLAGKKSAAYKKLFGDEKVRNPGEIKAALDRMLVDANVGFLYQTHVVALTQDRKKRVNGVVFGDPSGFQAIAAGAVVDATGVALKLSGARGKKILPGKHRATLFAVGRAKRKRGFSVTRVFNAIREGEKEYPLYRIERDFELPAVSERELFAAENAMRRDAWQENFVAVGDKVIFDFDFLPRKSARAGLFAPGDKIDFAAIPDAAQMNPQGKTIRRRGTLLRSDGSFRFGERQAIDFELDTLPELDTCDVLVAGGGTAGAPAAIAAAREKCDVLLVENLARLGGVTTAGFIASYWYGNRCGFSDEIDRGVFAMGKNPKFPAESNRCDGLWKSAYFLKELLASGGCAMLHTFVLGAWRDGKKVLGAIVATPYGAGCIRAKCVVDATGNADVAAAAGAECDARHVDGELAVQGAGIPPMELGTSYYNTDYQFVMNCDAVDLTRAFVMAHDKFKEKFDCSQLAGTRERRRIVGDLVLDAPDFFAHRTYRDTIIVARSNFDTHGFVVHPMFLLQPAAENPHCAAVPLRALLPRGLENIAVTGLAVSARRDAMPLIRMQPDVHNQGYAAGLAAAAAAKNGGDIRVIDVRALQRKLVLSGILEEKRLQETDSPGRILPEEAHGEIAKIFQNPRRHLPEIRARFRKDPSVSDGCLLAFLGCGDGAGFLRRDIARKEWDEGWDYRGMGQFGRSASVLDVEILAASRFTDLASALIGKIEALTPGSAFSHFRAVSVALRRHPSKKAVPALKKALARPGMTGHAVVGYDDIFSANRPERNDTGVRNAQLKELYLAAALYACSPRCAEAEIILRDYAYGMQGDYALFARNALKR